METANPPIVSPLTPPSESSPVLGIIIGLVLVVTGSVTGYFLAVPHIKSASPNSPIGSGDAASGQELGSTNSIFKDTATGTLEKGGLNGEGTHHLTRPGGVSQTVYLVSSVIDLDGVEGKKVEIFGQTLKAQKVGWLMDVGRVRIIE